MTKIFKKAKNRKKPKIIPQSKNRTKGQKSTKNQPNSQELTQTLSLTQKPKIISNDKNRTKSQISTKNRTNNHNYTKNRPKS